LFWVALRTFWSGWTKPLILVTPRTVVNWHRAGFRLYWTWISSVRQVGGRKRVSKEVRALIFRMVSENPTWGAPRIHGELLKLGFELSERSASRWIRRAPRDPHSVKRWLTFLRNHRGHCGNGFLHRPNAHVWCSVLLFRHRPRPAEDPASQCDAKSQCTLGCTAIERSMGLPTAAPILAIRPRRKVCSRGGFGGEGHGKRANSHGLSQSVAERCCGALGGKLPTRLAGPRDCPE